MTLEKEKNILIKDEIKSITYKSSKSSSNPQTEWKEIFKEMMKFLMK